MLSLDDKKILDDEFIAKFRIDGADREKVLASTTAISLDKGQILYENSKACHGFIIVKSGALRAFVSSENLKEITIFTIKEGESCLVCAGCGIAAFNEDLNLEVLEDTSFLLIPRGLFDELRQRYIELSSYTAKLMAGRFNSIVTLLGNTLFTPLSDRVLAFLAQNSKENLIKITHEEIANHLGSAREVVSRVLKGMEKDGLIEQKRGVIKILCDNITKTKL